MTIRTALRRTALGAGAIVLPIGLGATPAAAGSSTPPEPPVVESLGDPATAIVLPPAPQVGQTARNALAIVIDLSVDSESVQVGFDATVDAEITGVTPEGGYTMQTTIVEMQLTDSSEGVDASDFDLAALVGLQYEQVFSASGAVESTTIVGLESMDADTASLAQEFVESSQTVVVSYPTEAIGVGAKWSSEVMVDGDGFSIPVTYQLELTDITDGRFTVTITYSSDIDLDVEGTNMTGTVSGGGTVTGSVDNILDQALDLNQDMTVNVGSGDDAMDMTMVVEIDSTSIETVPSGITAGAATA
ncbi:hypothetical protein BH24ACT5_BH24ACT5_07540 [soil metagenome]